MVNLMVCVFYNKKKQFILHAKKKKKKKKKLVQKTQEVPELKSPLKEEAELIIQGIMG